MKKSGFNTSRKLLALAILAAPVMQVAADEVVDALMKSKVTGNFRLRHESVDLKSTTVKDADALTLRSRVGIETAPLSGFTALVEFENTQVMNSQDHYAPESAGYAAIVDPAVTEVNRAYVRYRGVPKLDLGLGRQRIALDNQRFVGSVSWRQDEQTFDAFTASYAGVPDWNFYYAFINKVNGIADAGVVSNNVYNFDIDSADSLFNVAYTGLVFGKLSAYYYQLNNEERATQIRNLGTDANTLNPTLRYRSNDTAGARFDGFYLLPITLPVRLLYTAEYAQQQYGDYRGPANISKVDYDTTYSLVDLGVGYASPVGMLSARVAQETLGSDTTRLGTGLQMQGFQTPYATKHAFNGWVDMFLNTPQGGLEDQYATVAADLQPYGVKLMAVYHKYSEVDGPAGAVGPRNFGTEWNFQALKQFGANYTLGVKYGNYKADSEVATLIGTTANVDTKKLWLWGELNF